MKLKPLFINSCWGSSAVIRGTICLLISCGQVLAASSIPVADRIMMNPDKIQYQPLAFKPPRVEKIHLENGMHLYVLPNKELPLIQIRAVIRTGSIYDPIGREGLTELTATTMRTGGTLGMTGDEVDEALESMAAVLHVSVNRDSAVFTISFLKKDLNPCFEIFSRMLMEPSLEEAKLLMVKDLKIEELRRILDDPQKLAFREFGRLMYADSPWGRLVTRDSVHAIGRDDLVRFHKLFFQPQNVSIAVTGDIESREAKVLIERHFGHWKSLDKIPEPPPLPRPQEGKVFFMKKDLPQSIVLIGWSAPAKKSARFYPFEVLDFMIGSGGFGSRIFQEIRTNMGLAYSTGSFYNAKSDHGIFGAYALTKSESTVEVASRIEEIIREMREKTVPPKELERARRSITNSFIFSFTSADKIAFQKLMINYEGLPDDYLETYSRKIEEVNVNDIQNQAVQRLVPDRAIRLIVGNEEVYKDMVHHYGTVTRMDPTF